jgi:hypothetical protein
VYFRLYFLFECGVTNIPLEFAVIIQAQEQRIHAGRRCTKSKYETLKITRMDIPNRPRRPA